MAIQRVARGTSLAWTGGSATGPLSDIVSYDFQQTKELPEVLDAGARVVTHYRGQESATLVVETYDIDTWNDTVIGDIVTSLILTVEGAIEGNSTSVGDDVTITFSQAIVTEKGNITHTQEDSTPATATITFKLHRAASDNSDPTVTVAASA